MLEKQIRKYSHKFLENLENFLKIKYKILIFSNSASQTWWLSRLKPRLHSHQYVFRVFFNNELTHFGPKMAFNFPVDPRV